MISWQICSIISHYYRLSLQFEVFRFTLKCYVFADLTVLPSRVSGKRYQNIFSQLRTSLIHISLKFLFCLHTLNSHSQIFLWPLSNLNHQHLLTPWSWNPLRAEIFCIKKLKNTRAHFTLFYDLFVENLL